MRTNGTPNRENSSPESSAARRQSQSFVPTAPLPEHISQNIETITALHRRNEQGVPQHQRLLESVTAFFSRPTFFYSVLLMITLWMLLNIWPQRLGGRQLDRPPFAWLELSLSIGAFLMTTGVLIRQDRQENLAEQRAQLSLQLHLLSEQKIAKLITLVEELRSDLPNVRDRHDPEAEVMKQAVDPHAVLNALEETLAAELAELQQPESSS
jgi:uncharacterized membrane protein